MRKICVFTGTRAEYGLLKPLMDEIVKDDSLRLQLLVTGMHLSPEFGMTYRVIENDGFVIDEKVEILLSADTPAGISKSMGLGLIGFADALARLTPDIAIILGDRFECLAMACACLNARIPIAHIHGGEITMGAVDEAFRHSITKMGHLHFTSTEEYRQRVIQLGEHPDRVFNVGALGIENIRNLPLLSKEELAEDIRFDLDVPYFLVTFHPVTLENATAREQFSALLAALDEFKTSQSSDIKLIFTKANADTDGRIINQMIDQYVGENSVNSTAFTSMGQLRYLSGMKYASAVVGNSSSGIIETPSFRVPTVNIGDRQKGRVRAESVIDCEPLREPIQKALLKAISAEFHESLQNMINPYEQEGTARNILDVLNKTDLSGIMKKEFYDLRSC
ncbi:UDP-N-acetylglucosamine 2-epimerase [Desulfonatronovibrio magnus]|uniref:UDP-N-acetylglucosamine 2-epimerase n=1 Tax=Desulfonatronovibrio magnus TaxID=698827 RepID=UPI0005EBA83F|nr:UDP-N-acetylglucosamine 2-epimerase [Desulfonatronovibrio magnus]